MRYSVKLSNILVITSFSLVNNREKQNFLFKTETTKTLKKSSIKILSELTFVDKYTRKTLWRQIFTYLQEVTRSVKIYAIGN